MKITALRLQPVLYKIKKTQTKQKTVSKFSFLLFIYLLHNILCGLTVLSAQSYYLYQIICKCFMFRVISKSSGPSCTFMSFLMGGGSLTDITIALKKERS